MATDRFERTSEPAGRAGSSYIVLVRRHCATVYHHMVRTTRPKAGDKILIFKEHWRDLVLRRRKTMEVRCTPLKAGRYWIGCRGVISGRLTLGSAIVITDENMWGFLRERHCVEGDAPPYKRTFGLPVLSASRVEPLTFTHPRGAIGIVRYQP